MALRQHRFRFLGLVLLLTWAAASYAFSQSDPAASQTPTQDSAPNLQNPTPENHAKNNVFYLELDYGPLFWQGQAYPTTQSDAYPDVNGIRNSGLNNLGGLSGVRVGIPLGGNVRLSPGLELSFDEYVYKEALGRAFPTHKSTGNAVGPVASVLGLLVSVPVDFLFDVGESVYLELSPGLAFYPLLPVEALDNSEGIEQIGNYLNKNLKWLYPMAAVKLLVSVSPWLEIGPQLRALIPVWHLWDENTLDFYDRLYLSASLIVRFKF